MRRHTFVLLGLLLALSAACGGGSEGTPTPSPIPPRVEVAPGVFARAETPPLLPAGVTALSNYYVFDSTEDTGVVIGLPLTQSQPADAEIGFYYYSADKGWAGVIAAISLEQDGAVLQGAFPSVPANLIVLLWPESASPPASP